MRSPSLILCALCLAATASMAHAQTQARLVKLANGAVLVEAPNGQFLGYLQQVSDGYYKVVRPVHSVAVIIHSGLPSAVAMDSTSSGPSTPALSRLETQHAMTMPGPGLKPLQPHINPNPNRPRD